MLHSKQLCRYIYAIDAVTVGATGDETGRRERSSRGRAQRQQTRSKSGASMSSEKTNGAPTGDDVQREVHHDADLVARARELGLRAEANCEHARARAAIARAEGRS